MESKLSCIFEPKIYNNYIDNEIKNLVNALQNKKVDYDSFTSCYTKLLTQKETNATKFEKLSDEEKAFVVQTTTPILEYASACDKIKNLESEIATLRSQITKLRTENIALSSKLAEYTDPYHKLPDVFSDILLWKQS